MMTAMFVAIIRHSQYGMTFEMVNDALAPFFRNHVTYSSLLVCMIPMILAVIQLTTVRRWRIYLKVLLVITIVALYFSYARGAWLALFTGLLVYWLLKKKLLVLSFILFFSFCIGAVFWLRTNDNYLKYTNDYKTTIFHTNFEEHLIATYKLKDVSTAERFYRWVAGVRMIKDSWRTGFGPTTFYDNYQIYAIPAFRTWVSNNAEHSTVHNYYLLTIIEQGALGLLLLLVLIGSMFWYAQKIYHQTDDRFWKIVIAATASTLMMVCTVNFLSDMIETDKVGSIFYLCLATIIIADIQTREKL
jgi:O-antigen ligase